MMYLIIEINCNIFTCYKYTARVLTFAIQFELITASSSIKERINTASASSSSSSLLGLYSIRQIRLYMPLFESQFQFSENVITSDITSLSYVIINNKIKAKQIMYLKYNKMYI